MNKKNTVNDMLRDRYMASQLKKTVIEKRHPTLENMGNIEYLRRDIETKLYNPLFHPEKFQELGVAPPKTVLLKGISGAGKSYLISCFCQSHQIPLISGFVGAEKDIRDLFSKSKAVDKSVIYINTLDAVLEESKLVYLLNSLIKTINWNAIVVIAHQSGVDKIYYENEIFIKIPSLQGRMEILNEILKGVKSSGLDLLQIAQHTPGFVPRDLVKLVSMAATAAIERRMGGYVPECQFTDAEGSLLVGGLSGAACGEGLAVEMCDFAKSIKEWKSVGPLVVFDDIGAMEKVKEELRTSVLLPSRYPERFLRFGVSKPSGVLLFGPPGCGKTLIAKAVSNMSHCNFLSIKGPELITKYVGDSEKHLRDLFQKAKNLSPCVLFFDEIDSLCGRRGKNEFGNRIVNQILTLLDGMEDRGEVYIIGATNRISSIDPALMRPGRFDKIVEVPLPNLEEAQEIFKKCISRMPIEPFDQSVLDLSGLSGADISGVVKEAAVMCLRENFEKADLKVGLSYFQASLEKHRKMKKAVHNKR